MVSPQVVFLLEYKGGGGGVCIEYKQGTVENLLPIAANECICVCVCGGGGCDGMGGGGVIRILKNLMGVINSIYYIKEPKSS